MTDSKRRTVVQTLSAASATAIVGSPFIWTRNAQAQLKYKPETGAHLRVLRWKRFVQGDEDMWLANTKKFSDLTGIPVRTDNEGWEDVRPKAAVAANVGQGPDIILGWMDDPHLYPEKLLDLTELAEYLGKKYGGWYPTPRIYGTTAKGRWIGLPLGVAGALINYRTAWMKEAGFDKFPTNFDDYLRLCQGLRKINHPPGFALSHAIGDSETWMHNILWGFGGKMVDEKSVVTINSPETIRSIEYMQELAKTFIEGTAAWSGVSNNNAFLEGKISLTSNGISIYYSAKNSTDPAKRAIAEDMNHSAMPVGPAGVPAELHLLTQAMVMKYTKYPNAAREYLRFMWEREQYEPWQAASIGYISQPLRAYASNKFWDTDPKYAPFRNVAERMRSHGYAGPLGYASAACLADWIVVDMYASACTGGVSPKDAAAQAEKRAKRYYA